MNHKDTVLTAARYRACASRPQRKAVKLFFEAAFRCAFVSLWFIPLAHPQSTSSAVAELNKGNIFEAVRQLKEAVRAEPSSGAAYFYLSTVYTGLGHNDTAYRYLEAAMKATPDQGAYYHQLGVIRIREGCRPEALEAFQQALQRGMGKDESRAWRHAGDVYVDLLAPERAVEAYQNAIKFDPNDAAAHLALGKLYLDRNNSDRAILELSAALKLSPDLDGVHAGLGRAWRAAGDPATAINILKQGVERNPSDQEARYVLGQTLLSLGRTDEGRREIGLDEVTAASLVFAGPGQLGAALAQAFEPVLRLHDDDREARRGIDAVRGLDAHAGRARHVDGNRLDGADFHGIPR